MDLKAPKRVRQASPKKKRPPKKKSVKTKRNKVGFFKRIFRTLFILGLWGFMLGAMALVWFIADLPSIEELQVASRRPSVTIQSEDGEILGAYGDLYEDVIHVNDLPKHVPQALMAVEDRRFYQHFGVDIMGIARAFYINYTAGRVVQGASTITQQLAKNLLFANGKYYHSDRSIKRKIQEVILAIWLEHHFSKDQILTMYLNRVYFGSGTYGIDAAAQRYFNKSARDMNVFEAALTAGLLKAPSRYSPASNPNRSLQRAKVVLELMKSARYIDEVETHLAIGEESLERLKSQQGNGYKYFTDWIYEAIPEYIGPITNDLVVVTTLDIELQKHSENVVRAYLDSMGKDLKASQAATIALRPDGAVVAMVGGKSYAVSQFNRVTQALRQPGSAFKPFVYLAGLEHGITPDTLIDDTPPVIGNWQPKNYKYISQGEITMRYGFMKSINAIAIRIVLETGPEAIVDICKRLGISSPMNPDLSISLGTPEITLLELASAFGTFANNGYPVWAYGIKEIRDRNGNILYKHKMQPEKRIIKENNLDDILEMLRSVIAEGTGRAVNVDPTVIGKTGSNGDTDAYFIGYRGGNQNQQRNDFRNIVLGVWIGNDDNSPMKKRSVGGRMPARIAASIMRGKVNSRDTNGLGVIKKKPVVKKEASAPAVTNKKTTAPKPNEIQSLQDLLD